MADISKMSLYEKIMEIKTSKEIRGLQKDAKNKFGKYDYYSSSQITNTILKKLHEYRIMSKFTFPKNSAILNLINLDNIDETDETIAYMPDFQPMAGKMGLIMSVGSYHTFMKRYLYMDVFEICEADPEELNSLFEEDIENISDVKEGDGEEDQDKVYRTSGDVIAYATRLSKNNNPGNILKVINKLHAPLDLKQGAREQLLQNSIMIKKYDIKLTCAQIVLIVKSRMELDKVEKKPSNAMKVLNNYNKKGLCDKETCKKVVTYIMGLTLDEKGEFL